MYVMKQRLPDHCRHRSSCVHLVGQPASGDDEAVNALLRGNIGAGFSNVKGYGILLRIPLLNETRGLFILPPSGYSSAGRFRRTAGF